MSTYAELSTDTTEDIEVLPSSKLNKFVRSLGAVAGGFMAIEMAFINMAEAAFNYNVVPDETAYTAIAGGVLIAIGCILSIANDEKPVNCTNN